MQGLKDLFGSERGLLGLVLVISATVFVALDKMTVEAWQSFCKLVFATYVGGKTVTGAVAMMTGKSDPVRPEPVEASGTIEPKPARAKSASKGGAS